jgi:hypothetical protein
MTLWGYAGRPYLKDVALAALEEPPEYRILQKSLRYLTQMPYSLHDHIIDELLDLMEGTTPLLPYHVAAILGSLRFLHPSVARLNLAHRITSIGFQRKAEWPVRQQALQLLAILPARERTAIARATNSLKHHHPFVRRAAVLMLSRAAVQDVRTWITRLLHDPDPAVSRLAGQWHRHLSEPACAMAELQRLVQSEPADRQFIYQVPKLYLIRASSDVSVINTLRQVIGRFGTSRSARVRYHCDTIGRQTQWVLRQQ